MPHFVFKMAAVATAMLLADAQPPPAPEPAPEPAPRPQNDAPEAPSPKEVASMELSLALRQEAAALQEGRDALKVLHELVTGINVTKEAHAAAQQAIHSSDPDFKEMEALEGEIKTNLEAMSVTVQAEVDGLASDEAKSAAKKQQKKAAKAAKKAEKATAKSQATQTKAKELAEEEADATAKAKNSFQKAVKYSTEEVNKLLKEEAEAQQRAAEKLAEKHAEQLAEEKERAAKAAAVANPIADTEAEIAAKEKAAREQADELETRASPSQEPTMLLEENPDQTSASKASAPVPEEDDVESEVDRIEQKVEEKAVWKAPKRFAHSISEAESKLKRLQEKHYEAVESTFFAAHKKNLAEIEAKVGQVHRAAERAKGFARTAARARTVLEQPEGSSEPDEDLVGEARKAGNKAKELEERIIREAKHELERAVEKDIAEDKEEARAWTSAAEKLLRERKHAKHGDEDEKGHKHFNWRAYLPGFAAVPSASSPLSLLAVSFGVTGFISAARSANSRRIRQQPPLLG